MTWERQEQLGQRMVATTSGLEGVETLRLALPPLTDGTHLTSRESDDTRLGQPGYGDRTALGHRLEVRA